MSMVEVAVTGAGVVSAFGWGTEPFWEGLVAGNSALAPLTRFRPVGEGRLAGVVPPCETRTVAGSTVARRMDWVSRNTIHQLCRAFIPLNTPWRSSLA